MLAAESVDAVVDTVIESVAEREREPVTDTAPLLLGDVVEETLSEADEDLLGDGIVVGQIARTA